MTIQELINQLESIPKEYKTLDALLVVNGKSLDVGFVSCCGDIYGVDRNGMLSYDWDMWKFEHRCSY